MKKVLLGAVITAMVAAPAFAGTVKYVGGPYQSGSGGEFTYQVIDASGGIDISRYSNLTSNIGGVTPSFQTFCLETDEFIQAGSTYNAALSDTAMRGGKNTNSGDPLSLGTAYLYSRFATGTLASYAYSGTTAERKASAAALQEAIWWLEEEVSAYTALNPFINLVVLKFGSDAAGKLDAGSNNYGVRVLNLTTTGNCANGKPGPYCQDALIYVPDGGATLSLLGVALFAIGAVRRRLAR